MKIVLKEFCRILPWARRWGYICVLLHVCWFSIRRSSSSTNPWRWVGWSWRLVFWAMAFSNRSHVLTVVIWSIKMGRWHKTVLPTLDQIYDYKLLSKFSLLQAIIQSNGDCETLKRSMNDIFLSSRWQIFIAN